MLPSSPKWIALLSALAFGCLLFVGYRNGAILVPADPFALRPLAAGAAEPPTFRFTDVTSSMLPKNGHYYPAYHSVSYVAAADFDNDGFVDAAYSTAESMPNLYLLRNQGGKKFTFAALPAATKCRARAVQFIDADNDGWNDLFVSCSPPEGALFFRNERGTFRNASRFYGTDKVRGDIVAATLIDYDRDGFVDLYLSLFIGPNEALPPYSPDSPTGGRNILLRNENGRHFRDVAPEVGADDSHHTWIGSAADFDENGWPDLFLVNDFGIDRLLLNHGGKFSDAARHLGRLRSRNSMSAEVTDVNGDGHLDIYVSNANKPGMVRGWNSLWMNQGPGAKQLFQDKAYDLGVDRCGFSWGAKFEDLDRDGKQDLIVVNGFLGPGGSTPRWYRIRGYTPVIPDAIRRLSAVEDPWTEMSAMAGKHEACVFHQTEKGFVDVAADSGFVTRSNHRGVSRLDFDNNGTPDFLISHYDRDPTLFRNDYLGNGKWLGIELRGTKSNRMGVGAVVRLRTSARTYVQAHYPSNGFHAQRDPRLHFAIPAGEEPQTLSIEWPSGVRQELPTPPLGRYTEIHEKAD